MSELDLFRERYTEMSYAEHEAFYSRVYAAAPVQRHFNVDATAAAIEEVAPATVVEIGSWDGALAALMLERFSTIQVWRAVEICREAAAISATAHPRLRAVEVGDWYWTRRWQTDLFVASHTIEHLSAEHFEAMVAATDTRAFYFDAPLTLLGHSWMHNDSTHLLEKGWSWIDYVLAARGFELSWRVGNGFSTACLYVADAS